MAPACTVNGMRLRILSVCAVVLVVFFGLQCVLRSVEPHAPGRMAVLTASTGQEPSRNHLASLASIAAGAVAFAAFPKRRRTPRAASSAVRTMAPPIESVVRCPQCNQQMRRILMAGGEHRGRTLWLCPQSPDCDIRPPSRRSRVLATRDAALRMVRG